MWGVMQWGSRPDVATCQRFVDGVLARSWARRLWPGKRVTVDDSGGKGGACATSSRIEVSTYYRNHIVLLHELAHCLTPADVGHGRDWARVYLMLVTRVMGADAGRELRAQFLEWGVKFKRVTAAQRAAGRRLAAATGGTNKGLEALAAHREQKRLAKLAEQAKHPGMVKHSKHGWVYPGTRYSTVAELTSGLDFWQGVVDRRAGIYVSRMERENGERRLQAIKDALAGLAALPGGIAMAEQRETTHAAVRAAAATFKLGAWKGSAAASPARVAGDASNG
jgi:hypothetical protein